MNVKKMFFNARGLARKHNIDRRSQIELAYLEKKVWEYGFNFFPDHYLEEPVREYVRTVEDACGVKVNKTPNHKRYQTNKGGK